MSKTRNLSDLLDANGDVKSTALDNVPPSNDASALTTGTLPNDRLSAVPNSALANSSITINGSATSLGGSATINTDLVNDATPSLGGDLASNGNDINFGDNDKAVFGAGSDLQIYHDGSDQNSYIKESGSGFFYIDATNFRARNTAGTETFIRADENDAVKLYYDNAEKLATTSSGIDVTGTITFDGGTTSADLNFGDNDKANFGAGNDLQIYSDGSNGFITESDATGYLYIRGTNLRLQNTAGTQTYINANDNGAVDLRYAGSTKIATTSGGATVTGTLTATAFSGDGSALTGISSGLSNKFHAWGKNSTGSAAGWRTINFSTETVDDDNKFNHTSGTYTVPATGNYVLFAGHFHNNGLHNDYRIRFYSTTNGTLASTSAVDGDRVTTSGIMALTINEVIRVDVYHGNNAHSDAGTRGSFFGGYRLI